MKNEEIYQREFQDFSRIVKESDFEVSISSKFLKQRCIIAISVIAIN